MKSPSHSGLLDANFAIKDRERVFFMDRLRGVVFLETRAARDAKSMCEWAIGVYIYVRWARTRELARAV